MDRYLVVFLGAGLGGVCRYAVGHALAAYPLTKFPFATFAVNVTGSFLIGLAMTYFVERAPAQALWRLFLVVGVLGGYTTFSSFEYEIFHTVREGAPGVAALYIAASVLAGYGAVWLGSLVWRA